MRATVSRPTWSDAPALLGLALAYFVVAKLGLALAVVHASATAIWPATGLAIGALLVGGRRLWPAVFAGAFAANATTAGTVATSLGIATGNTLEAIVGAVLVARYASGRGAFERLPDFGRFLLLAGAVAPLVSATVGVGSLVLGGAAPASAFGAVWFTWWLGDAVGAVAVAPAVILGGGGWRGLDRRAAAHAAAALGAVAAVGVGVFALPGAQVQPLAFLALPPMVAAAYRFGARGAAAGTLLLGGIALAATMAGRGPFGDRPPHEALLLLATFLAVVSVMSLGLAAVVAERRRVEDEVRAARDLLEERVAERTATLARQRALLSEAERIARLGTWEWDVVTGAVRWSDEMYRIYGYPGGTPVTLERAMERVPPDDAARIRRNLAAALAPTPPGAPEQEVSPTEYAIVLPDGRRRALRGLGRVVRGPDGRALRMVGTVQDVTDRKAAEDARVEADRQRDELAHLKELDRFKTQFLNMAAHELSTPLTPIRLQLEVLRDPRQGEAGRKKSVDILERNVERLVGLVRDILEAARLQAGRLTVRPAPMDLAVAVREAAETFEEPANASSIALEVRSAGPIPVVADAGRIQQVLINLLSNAWKFTPPGGRIVVEAGLDGDAAVVRVRDTGAGIAPEDIPRLFQPFTQLPYPDRRPEGTGLGLYICRGIVELHGGRIWCESAGRGQGATFALAIPVAAAAFPEASDARAAVTP